MAKRVDPAVTAYLSRIGQKGGSAKVPKGVAMLSDDEKAARGKAAAEARWSKRKRKSKSA